jgi:hypothetical protein
MTQVYLHPDIADYFVEYDFGEVARSPANGGPQDLRRKVMEDYVGAKCILLRNVRIDYDIDFVRSVQFPPTWFFKKFPSKVVERPKPLEKNPVKQDLCRDLFGGDAGLFRRFESEVRAVNGGIRRVLDELLRHHRVEATDIIWRHTETRVENLHFDIDQDSAGFESVRLYLNMDDIPRIWHTSYQLGQIVPAYYEELELGSLKDQPLERLLQVLSLRLFGNWSSRGREQFPRHMVLFEPGDVWICDGRTVPHQVIYGRRVASSFYRLDKHRLPAWHPSLAAKVQDMHSELGGEPSDPSPLKGYDYPFDIGGPKPPKGVRRPDLKAEWDKLYEESIQPKLVRL